MTRPYRAAIADKIEPDLNSGCHLWNGASSLDGYGVTWRAMKNVPAHRVAYCEANGISLADIAGSVVRHKCDTPLCVTPEHLMLGTKAENNADKATKGRKARVRGMANGSSKLTDVGVAEMRAAYAGGGVTFKQLATRYGVSVRAAWFAVRRVKWRHVQ